MALLSVIVREKVDELSLKGIVLRRKAFNYTYLDLNEPVYPNTQEKLKVKYLI